MTRTGRRNARTRNRDRNGAAPEGLPAAPFRRTHVRSSYSPAGGGEPTAPSINVHVRFVFNKRISRWKHDRRDNGERGKKYRSEITWRNTGPNVSIRTGLNRIYIYVYVYINTPRIRYTYVCVCVCIHINISNYFQYPRTRRTRSPRSRSMNHARAHKYGSVRRKYFYSGSKVNIVSSIPGHIQKNYIHLLYVCARYSRELYAAVLYRTTLSDVIMAN